MYFGLCLLALSIFLFFLGNRTDKKKYPPGPRTVPFLGHLPFLAAGPHKVLLNWKKKYGPVMYCNLGVYNSVVLSDSKSVKQCLSQAAAEGKAKIKSFTDLSYGLGLFFSEGKWYKEQRRFLFQAMKDFGLAKAKMNDSIQEGLSDFLADIQNLEGKAVTTEGLFDRHAGRMLWTAIMSQRLSPDELHHIVHVVFKGMLHLGTLLHQLALFVPWFGTLTRWLTFGKVCLTKTKTDAYKEIHRFMEQKVAERKKTWMEGHPRDITDMYLDQIERTDDETSSFHRKHTKNQAVFLSDLFLAGVESTSRTLRYFLIYMVNNPRVQMKLREEIDLVLGRSRLPSLQDRFQMPYADAVLHETLRYSSIPFLGIPHHVTEDVTVSNEKIPKDTMVIVNYYALLHDPEVWGPDVEEFKPERWLGDEGKSLKDNHFLPFSTGRRVCPGEEFAKANLFVYMTALCQSFEIRFEGRRPDNEGPWHAMLSPDDFNVLFLPRD